MIVRTNLLNENNLRINIMVGFDLMLRTVTTLSANSEGNNLILFLLFFFSPENSLFKCQNQFSGQDMKTRFKI